jgi:hypothetical protein
VRIVEREDVGVLRRPEMCWRLLIGGRARAGEAELAADCRRALGVGFGL